MPSPCPVCKRAIDGAHDIDVIVKGTTIAARVPCPGAAIQETFVTVLRDVHERLRGIADHLYDLAKRIEGGR